MNTIRGVVKNGAILWRQPITPLMREGEELELRIAPGEDWESVPDGDDPLTPEEIQRILAAMDRLSGDWLDADDLAACEKRRAEHREWEFSQRSARSKKLHGMLP